MKRAAGLVAVQAAYDLTASVLEAHPYARQLVAVHLAAAVELGLTAELFLLGHRWAPLSQSVDGASLYSTCRPLPVPAVSSVSCSPRAIMVPGRCD